MRRCRRTDRPRSRARRGSCPSPRAAAARGARRSAQRLQVANVGVDARGDESAILQIVDLGEGALVTRTEDATGRRWSDPGELLELRRGRVVDVDLRLGIASEAAGWWRLAEVRDVDARSVTQERRAIRACEVGVRGDATGRRD